MLGSSALSSAQGLIYALGTVTSRGFGIICMEGGLCFLSST